MDINKSSSSSEEKARFLPDLLKTDASELIIAVGTAGYIADGAVAGCVVVGSRFFIHNGHPNNPGSNFQSDRFDELLPQNSNTALVQLISLAFKLNVEPKFLKTPNNPALRGACLASQFYTAISSVNVLDYGEYAWVDMEAVAKFRDIEKKLPVGSLETTHGVIRLCTETPMMFISAITDREGDFDIEVTAGQNYISASMRV